MKKKINYGGILIFYIIAVSLRYLTNKTALLDHFPNIFLKAILQGIGPAVGAIVVFTLFKIKAVLSLKGNYKKLVTPFILYWVLPVLLISTVQYFANGTIAIATVFTILIYGLLEEIGWRGYLQQELKSLSPFLSIIIIATLWFIWHLNFDFSSSNLLFWGILVLGSWGIGKVADSTHSLIAVSAFHSLNNFFPEVKTTQMIIIITLVIIWVISLMIGKKQSKKALATAAA